MKNGLAAMLAVLLIAISGCGQVVTNNEAIVPQKDEEIESEHSALYVDGFEVEEVIEYFNEVCLDSEFVDGGDPSVVQKWEGPIYYTLEGDYTVEDKEMIESFAGWLNDVEGFPGIFPTSSQGKRNLQIRFCTQSEITEIMGPNYENVDGAVSYNYTDDIISDATICYSTDVDQWLRNSVILEEIYNGLGPMQDTVLRSDSIIYQEYSDVQWLSPIDELILKLMYHPEIKPGMNAAECERVIRRLYY